MATLDRAVFLVFNLGPRTHPSLDMLMQEPEGAGSKKLVHNGSLYSQPKQCTILREIPQKIPCVCIKFDPPKMGPIYPLHLPKSWKLWETSTLITSLIWKLKLSHHPSLSSKTLLMLSMLGFSKLSIYISSYM